MPWLPWVWVDDPIYPTTVTVATGTAYPATFNVVSPTMGGGGAWMMNGGYNPYQAQVMMAQQAYHNQLAQQYNNQQSPLPPQQLDHPSSPAVIREREEAAERRRREYRLEQETREAAMRVADGKAEDLLRRLLDPDQLVQLEAHGYFDVPGSRGNRYRIRRGKIANVEVFGDRHDTVLHRLCVHPANAHELPVGDVMAAQLLHLRANENEILRIAHRHPALH